MVATRFSYSLLFSWYNCAANELAGEFGLGSSNNDWKNRKRQIIPIWKVKQGRDEISFHYTSNELLNLTKLLLRCIWITPNFLKRRLLQYVRHAFKKKTRVASFASDTKSSFRWKVRLYLKTNVCLVAMVQYQVDSGVYPGRTVLIHSTSLLTFSERTLSESAFAMEILKKFYFN